MIQDVENKSNPVLKFFCLYNFCTIDLQLSFVCRSREDEENSQGGNWRLKCSKADTVSNLNYYYYYSDWYLSSTIIRGYSKPFKNCHTDFSYLTVSGVEGVASGSYWGTTVRLHG